MGTGPLRPLAIKGQLAAAGLVSNGFVCLVACAELLRAVSGLGQSTFECDTPTMKRHAYVLPGGAGKKTQSDNIACYL